MSRMFPYFDVKNSLLPSLQKDAENHLCTIRRSDDAFYCVEVVSIFDSLTESGKTMSPFEILRGF